MSALLLRSRTLFLRHSHPGVLASEPWVSPCGHLSRQPDPTPEESSHTKKKERYQNTFADKQKDRRKKNKPTQVEADGGPQPGAMWPPGDIW